MSYVLVQNDEILEYPLYEGDIKLRFPNSSFPIPFTPPENYFFVEETPSPEYDYTKNIVEGTPEKIDGKWYRTWKYVDASPEEIQKRIEYKALEVRNQRNKLLLECDWTQLPDSPVDSNVWKEYRQLLRDITTQEEFPWQVNWPEKPN